jgi:hypothetical protein
MGRLNAGRRSEIQGKGFTGLAAFQNKIDALDAGLLPSVGKLAFESVVDGSRLTGAPGQPVGESGDLKASWSWGMPTDTEVAIVSTSPYARFNEDGVRAGGKPYVQHSGVGGRHSLRLTRLGLQAIVNYAANLVMRRAA